MDGQPAKRITSSHGEKAFRCAVNPPEELGVQPEDIPLRIVYQDADICVVGKPQGMVVHPAPGNGHRHHGKRAAVSFTGSFRHRGA